MAESNLLSVVICAHNPRSTYLERTLAALAAQTLPRTEWELLLVDNASRESLAGRFDLTWHPQAQHIVEPQLGLTRARLRGLAQSRGQLLIFVDDDNVLAPDYLAIAAHMSAEKNWLGAWGGRVEPEFEIPPPPWLAPYLPLLAVNQVPVDQWSNYANPSATPPCGAGMCVRRAVVEAWRDRVLADPLRAALGRAGSSLASSEDIDLAFTACDLGLASGRFTALRLTHLIPKERLELDYIARLVEGVTASQILVRSLRESLAPPPAPRGLTWLRERWRDWRRDPVARRLCAAERRGRALAFAQLGARPNPQT